MFSSGYPATALIDAIEKEVNISFPVSADSYCNWINSTEQLLYSDIIREQRYERIDFTEEIPLSSLPYDEYHEDLPRFTDIHRVYLEKDGIKTELEHTDAEKVFRGIQAENSYYFDGFKMKICADGAEKDKLIIVRIVRPIPKKVVGDIITGTVALPPEFLELMFCKLRGERYRLINEDALCAKWINEYNAQLETFKAYIEARRSEI